MHGSSINAFLFAANTNRRVQNVTHDVGDDRFLLFQDSTVTWEYDVTAADFCSVVPLITKLYSTYEKRMFEKYFISSGRVTHSTRAHVLVHPANANSPQRELARNAFAKSRGAHLCNSKCTP